jgi:putative intracellular protease/amidase
MTTVVIPVYDEVTQLDFTASHQFFSMVPNITVIVASVGGVPVSSQGLSFAKLNDLEEIDACDVLCVPGGLGCIQAMEEPRFLSAVRRLAGTAEYVTSVCSGSLILGAAGLLKGRRATCHWGIARHALRVRCRSGRLSRSARRKCANRERGDCGGGLRADTHR